MEKKVQSYNFRRPDRISTNQIRSLHFVHDRFARNTSSSISAYLRTIVEISLESIEQVTYTEFLSHAADPTCYAALSLKPLDGTPRWSFVRIRFFPRSTGCSADPEK